MRDAEKVAQKSARLASHAEGSASDASGLIRPASSAKQKGAVGRISLPAKQVWNACGASRWQSAVQG